MQRTQAARTKIILLQHLSPIIIFPALAFLVMLNTNPAEWTNYEKDEYYPNTMKEIMEGTENTISMLVNKRNQNIQENVKRNIIEMLTVFQRTRSPEYSSTGGVSSCSFSVKKIGWENGVCTYYGACRYQGQDYMYQVCACTYYGACIFQGLRLHVSGRCR